MALPPPIGPDLPGEIWQPVPGHEQYAEVSNLGRARSTPRIIGNEEANGYICLNLPGKVCGFGSSRGRTRHRDTFRVPLHRIVALAFKGKAPRGKMDINHIDGNKLNNADSNLEYCTRSHNIKHAYANGLRRKQTTRKLSDDDYRDIRRLYSEGGWTHETLAVKFQVSSVHIGYVLHRSPRKV